MGKPLWDPRYTPTRAHKQTHMHTPTRRTQTSTHKHIHTHAYKRTHMHTYTHQHAGHLYTERKYYGESTYFLVYLARLKLILCYRYEYSHCQHRYRAMCLRGSLYRAMCLHGSLYRAMCLHGSLYRAMCLHESLYLNNLSL